LYYSLYEMNRVASAPMRAFADATKLFYTNPLNPLSDTPVGRSVSAACEVFERATRRYAKPSFELNETTIDGKTVPVVEKIVWSRAFCKLIHFERATAKSRAKDPTILVVAPMSGHYATLLRGTVEALLPHGEVYITDWVDARNVPVADGSFDLDDYIDYVEDMVRALGPDTHVIAVCQPSVPVLAAVAVMAAENDPLQPASMTLMGGPVDTRKNPTAVNKMAEGKTLDWFRTKVIMSVPWPNPGFSRAVYPGFMQLTGFMTMNLDRHMTAHGEFFNHLVQGDGEPAEKHRDFYDEYMAVMDLTAEFYLQTVDTVFIKHSLPQGLMMHRAMKVDPSLIRKTALLTVEGENDDISGVGQTEAAQTLCSSLPDHMRQHYVQPHVGHYGVFNGSRFRAEIAPRIVAFIKKHNGAKASRKDISREDISQENISQEDISQKNTGKKKISA
jgi:poly(3-hydroxybutyrate) depolymerase